MLSFEHVPKPEQLPGQLGLSQYVPAQPGLQPHEPWLLHSRSHATPVKHGSHTHTPPSMGTWLPLTHGFWHAVPIHPREQLRHCGGLKLVPSQMPRPLQLPPPGQYGISQPSPTQPGLQKQSWSTALQAPWFVQSMPTPGQPCRSHLLPQKPGSHEQLPLTHLPFPEHSRSQLVPSKQADGSHTHTPLSIGVWVPFTHRTLHDEPIQ